MWCSTHKIEHDLIPGCPLCMLEDAAEKAHEAKQNVIKGSEVPTEKHE